MDRRLIDETVYNNLPKQLKDITIQFQGRERDIVLLSSLGVISNCLPNIIGEYDSDIIYPNLYILIIAPPASGKGVMNYSRILIEKIHEDIYSTTKKENCECEDRQRNQKEKTSCPEIKVKILPANISSAEMYSFLASSEHGLIIIESEADTMSNMLKNDWSNYSDVLRKAFHHEDLSLARKTEKVFEEVKEPKLSMVITGTPDQMQPLLKSKDNGLASRFIVYIFDEVSEFKDVFAKVDNGKRNAFNLIADELFTAYQKLISLNKPIEFEFTENQKAKFLKMMRKMRSDIIECDSQSFLSNLHRHGLMMFRIAMILTALRNIENLNEQEKIICSNKDFMVALTLMTTLLNHSEFSSNSFDNQNLSLQDEDILENLASTFTREAAVAYGSKIVIPSRTIDDKLAQWQKRKIIKRVKRGVFTKL